jgi:uncharacterized phage-associated protein
MPDSLTKEQIDKIGNALVYLTKNVGDPSITKLLKLLFFLEEESIRKYGYPFFGVDFKIWVRGPVLENVYFDFEQNSLAIFKEYVKRDPLDKDLWAPNKEFDDSEFSDNDIKCLDEICRLARHKTSHDLVALSHKKGSLWERNASEYGVYKDLVSEKLSTTNHLIDFSLLLEGNEFLKERYENAKENLDVIKSLK